MAERLSGVGLAQWALFDRECTRSHQHRGAAIDHREAVRAFQEKRAPRFTGK
jgi:hypothetical protein